MMSLYAHPVSRSRGLAAAALLLLYLCGEAHATPEAVTQVAHRIVDDGILVTYELVGTRACNVELWILRANRPYQYKARSVTGDIGRQVKPGLRRIHWQALEDLPELSGSGWIFEVRATRRHTPKGLYVVGGVTAAVIAGAALGSGGGGSDMGTVLITVSHPE